MIRRILIESCCYSTVFVNNSDFCVHILCNYSLKIAFKCITDALIWTFVTFTPRRGEKTGEKDRKNFSQKQCMPCCHIIQ